MSRIGKKPVPIVEGAEVKIKDRLVTVKGPKGELSWEYPVGVEAKIEENEVVITRNSDIKQHRAFHGLTRALINNMVIGVTTGFSKKLEIYGVGYNCDLMSHQDLRDNKDVKEKKGKSMSKEDKKIDQKDNRQIAKDKYLKEVVDQNGSAFILYIGFSHPVYFEVPEGVQIDIEIKAARGNDEPAKLTINGINKQVVGELTAQIRRTRPPEPYKGKGIRYEGEIVIRKEGKPMVSGGG